MIIEPFDHSRLDEVVSVWLAAGKTEYSYLPLFQALDQAKATQVFEESVLPVCSLRIAIDGKAVVGFSACEGDLIDRLYVDPSVQGRGIGSALIADAKRRSPRGLKLFTHQANARARTFYVSQGFRAVRFGVSPAPESMPDVLYHWGLPSAE